MTSSTAPTTRGTVLVPEALRMQKADRWAYANRLARSFGTPLCRYRWWRLPTACLWWLVLCGSSEQTVARGTACLQIQPVRAARTRVRPIMVVPLALAAVLWLAWKAVGLFQTDGLPGRLALTLALALAVPAVLLAETLGTFHRMGSLLLATDCGADAVREAGHHGPVVRIGGLCGAGDAGVLARAWLRHADHHGVAVVATAATEALADRYTRPAAGFCRVSPAGRQLYRLPAPHRQH